MAKKDRKLTSGLWTRSILCCSHSKASKPSETSPSGEDTLSLFLPEDSLSERKAWLSQKLYPHTLRLGDTQVRGPEIRRAPSETSEIAYFEPPHTLQPGGPDTAVEDR